MDIRVFEMKTNMRVFFVVRKSLKQKKKKDVVFSLKEVRYANTR